jgi:hypothetical protein
VYEVPRWFVICDVKEMKTAASDDSDVNAVSVGKLG